MKRSSASEVAAETLRKSSPIETWNPLTNAATALFDPESMAITVKTVASVTYSVITN